jgi:hypothetical protein
MLKASRFLVLGIFVLLSAASASQAGTFSLVGVGDVSKPSFSDSTDSYGSKIGYGGGILFDHGLAPWTSLEIGALYVGRKADDTTTGIVASSHAIQVPVLIRWWMVPMFSIAGGGYYARGIGNIDNTDGSGASSTVSYADDGYKMNDYGLTGSVALRLPLSTSMRLYVDGRYNYGLANISSVSDTVKNRDIQVLVGFQFAMHSSR